MKLLFTLSIYLDGLMALISLLYSIILLSKSKGKPIYFNFGMAQLALTFWLADLFLSFLNFRFITLLVIENFSFLFGLLIVHFFYIFTLTYPFEVNRRKVKALIAYFVTMVLSFSFFVPGLYSLSAVSVFPYFYTSINPIGLFIFILAFLIYSIAALVNLLKVYYTIDGIYKLKIKKIVLGTLVTIIFNVLFSMSIYFFTTFDTSVIGAMSVFTILMYVNQIIFKDAY
ncbi:MAG: hypothetical protein PHW95_03705 [Patescibacteria group bacterium]|nr:hypothetical protein [Patescibacteria group bacterium]